METLWYDLRHAARSLRRSAGFSTVAVLTLALGIGANTALFSVIKFALLQPVSFPDADRLAYLGERAPNFPEMSISLPDFDDWQAQGGDLFTHFGAYRSDSFNLVGAGEPERVRARMVSAGLLPAVGAQPIAGRLFAADDDQLGAPRTALISYALWQRRFSGDPSLVGRSITLSGDSYSVVGVLPKDFRFFSGGDVWVPLHLFADRFADRGSHPGLYAIGRMKPGVTLAKVAAAFASISARLSDKYVEIRGNSVNARLLVEVQAGPGRQALLVLWAAVGFVLLIAAANVANLMLARASARAGEIAIRIALGAGRWRIVRQLLTESVLLSFIGAALGVLIAVWGLSALAPYLSNLPRGDEIQLDAAALGFTIVVALVTGIAFGLLPALRASRSSMHGTLQDARITSGKRLRGGLVVAEVALSLVLLIGAGLLLRSFERLTRVSPGFDQDHLLTMQVSLPPTRYGTGPKLIAFEQRLREKAASIPGVASVAIASGAPFLGASETSIFIEGRPSPPGQQPEGNIYSVTADYLDTMRIPLLEGKFFQEQDRNVVIVDDALARKLFPGESPLGHRFAGPPGSPLPPMEIIGVVKHVQNYSLDGSGPVDMAFYAPYAAVAERFPAFSNKVFVLLRTNVEPLAVAQAVSKAVRELDPEQPVFNVKTMDDVLSESVSDRRLSMLLLAIFAALALLLAAVGIYGVMAYSVSQRTREIGIRVALGAEAMVVMRLLLGQGARLCGIGIAFGVVLALALSRLMASLLFSVSATDAATYAGLSILLGAVALLACWVPARRALRVDPVIALRAE